MLKDTERPDGHRAGSVTPESESSASTPWSVLSENGVGDNPLNGPLEPIAIIGMSCRLPGSAQDPSSLWDMLLSKRTAWTPGPGKRFNMAAFQDPSAEMPGTTNTCGGHFLKDDVAAFDASLFGINPLEATGMDPQHRLLLEIAYESFQNAGLSTESLSGSKTGVYVGQWSTDYHEIQARDIESPPLYLVTGTGPAISSNRISYTFNLKGPSYTVDTGCSSSLVAIHSAVQSLRSGETTQCFVGGVNMIIDPQRFAYQSRLKMFSKEGRSFAFDSRANGYGRGEGCVGMMLKPLSAALRDGNQIRAVIRNTALNQDGRTPGLTLPSAAAQREAIQTAYRQAMLDITADYVEAHGTGTKVGDPIEAGAIASAFAARMPPGSRLPIGSIKGNIGHTEGAAGLCGLIKAVLMLEHGIIPPQANYITSNPDVLLDDWNLRIPTQPERQRLRRISVNSFGYGGTNGHLVVDSAAEVLASLSRTPLYNGLQPPAPDIPRVFFISAACEKSCQRMCSRLAKYLILKHRESRQMDKVLARLAYGLGKQSVHPYRLALVASSLDSLVEKLITASQSAIARRDKKDDPRIAFVFSGQGAQYAEMGRELLKSYSSFVRSVERARQQLIRLGSPWDLLSELCRPKKESRINDPSISQPASTAVQLALVDLLAEYGISPHAVVGHSSGEIAAAYAARAISFEDAMTASYFRGKLTSEMLAGKSDTPGAMIAVGADPAVVEEHIAQIGQEHGRIRIACYNSPSSVTVSGDATGIDKLKEVLDTEGTFNRKLMTNGAAYHSHQMKAIEESYGSALKAPKKSSWAMVDSQVRMVSSVTGKELSLTALNGQYWVDNLISPVLFSQAFQAMCKQRPGFESPDMIIEVGPHSQLGGPIGQILKSISGGPDQNAYTSTLKRGKDAEVSFLECLGSIHVHSASLRLSDINRENMNKEAQSLLVDLPPYPFDHDRTFWHETRISKDYRHREHLPHQLLGSLTQDVNRLEPRWRRFISLKTIPWLRGHLVQGQIVFPAAGFITMAIQAARQYSRMTTPNARVESVLLRNISINKALVLPEDGPDTEVSLSLRPQARTARESSAIWNEFRIFTVGSDNRWTEHCRGLVRVETEVVDDLEAAPALEDIDSISARCTHEFTPQKFYHRGAGTGLEWLYPFNNLTEIRTSQYSSIATARAPSVDGKVGGMGDILHPAMLDAALFHGLCGVTFFEHGLTSTNVPNFIDELRIFNRPTPAPGGDLVVTSESSTDGYIHDVVARNPANSNEIIFVAQGLHMTKLPGQTSGLEGRHDLCHGVDWVTYVDAWTPEHRDQVCKAAVPSGSCTEQNRYYDALTIHFVYKALQQVDPAAIPDNHRRRFYEWMLFVAGNVKPGVVPAMPRKPDLDDETFSDAVLRLGPHLADILTQKIDPLQLLTPDGLLTRIYNVERYERCMTQISEYCHQLGKQTPELKVLEIGGGTGSATEPILKALKGQVFRFDFTDLSPGFFEGARRRLGDLADVVEFHTLDIERSPAEQGFEEGTYDLIIASNVVHATYKIDPVLANVRSLLKPGGKFVLMELTLATTHYGLMFGVFEGWWAGYAEGRKLSPLLRPAQWIPKLERAGFSQPEGCFQDYAEEDGGSTTVFVMSKSWDSPSELPPIDFVSSTPEDGNIIRKALMAPVTQHVPEAIVRAKNLMSPPPGGNIVVLLPELCRKLCSNPDSATWQAFKDWILSARGVLLVSNGNIDKQEDTDRGLWVGFSRCFRLEHPGIPMVTLDLEASDDLVYDRLAAVLPTVLRTMSQAISGQAKDIENEFAERSGQLYVSRLTTRREVTNHIHGLEQQGEAEMTKFIDGKRMLAAELGVPGVLETLRWKDDQKALGVGPDEVKLELRAASINFKDVLIAAGQLEGLSELKNDCSGVVVEVGANMRKRFAPGDRVCAMYSRAYTNYPVVHGDCCQIVPEGLSFEEAAGLPVIWATVYYSLVDMGRLSKGDRFLIHSGAGAVGQAAIMLAQHLGAEIFATVGSSSKADLLHERYGIPRDHIFSSRTTAFYSGIKRMTGGHGVDVVLNSLSGEMFRQSTNLVAPFGRFVEIGRKDFMDDVLMPMGFLLKNITFAYVDLNLIMDENKPLARRLLRDVADLAHSGSIRPVTLTVMPISEIETAFRQIQAGKHTGKIILRVEEDQKVMALPPMPRRAQLSPDATYAIVGGFGGLGRAMISWLGEHGAKNVLSLSRSGAKDAQVRAFIREMETKGVRVIAKKCDVASEEEVSSIVRNVARHDGLPPIRGVIQSAMVLQDSIFEDMGFEQWRDALRPKVQGTRNLHSCFKDDVDFFVLMSSAVTLRGNVGQSNYAGACSFQDTLARHRRAVGLPAFSINVGPVVDAGFVSENPEVAAALLRQGLGTITASQVLAMLNYAVTRPRGGNDGESVCCIGLMPNDGDIGSGADVGMTDRRFAHLVRKHAKVRKVEGESSDGLWQLDGATSFDEATEIVCYALLQQLGKLIATPADTLNPAQSLDSYGVDSLVAVELRNWIGAYLQANVQLMVLRGTGSIMELARIVTKESRLVSQEFAS